MRRQSTNTSALDVHRVPRRRGRNPKPGLRAPCHSPPQNLHLLPSLLFHSVQKLVFISHLLWHAFLFWTHFSFSLLLFLPFWSIPSLWSLLTVPQNPPCHPDDSRRVSALDPQALLNLPVSPIFFIVISVLWVRKPSGKLFCLRLFALGQVVPVPQFPYF